MEFENALLCLVFADPVTYRLIQSECPTVLGHPSNEQSMLEYCPPQGGEQSLVSLVRAILDCMPQQFKP